MCTVRAPPNMIDTSRAFGSLFPARCLWGLTVLLKPPPGNRQ